MALSSALFSGISGLSSLGNAMQVIGDNIANVNTVGFKGSTFTFQDLLSQNMFTRAGTSQVGRGTALSDICTNFEQGSFETTGNTTDLAIGGEGFFAVREAGSERLFYTRAGNFRFDQNGYLVNPEGYVVQGWAVDGEGNITGTTRDIALTSFTSQPEATETVTVIANLDKDSTSNIDTLTDGWDATSGGAPMSSSAYEYQSTVKVYDALGSTHDVTIYYDKSATASVWEYIITCNPSEDLRAGFAGDAQQGLLGRGTITFSESDGTITGITMDRLTAPDTWSALAPADANNDGFYEFQADFIGGTGADTTQNLALDIGTRWNGTTFVPSSLATTQFASSSTTVFQTSDGYGAGALQGVDVSVDGLITGSYSNGQVLPLYRLCLAKFQSTTNLKKEGGNLYSETRQSGAATTSLPGTNGLGNIAPNSLEQSNVDIANEFVKMITTQRGFQANSKIITVTDDMLAELINLKR